MSKKFISTHDMYQKKMRDSKRRGASPGCLTLCISTLLFVLGIVLFLL